MTDQHPSGPHRQRAVEAGANEWRDRTPRDHLACGPTCDRHLAAIEAALTAALPHLRAMWEEERTDSRTDARPVSGEADAPQQVAPDKPEVISGSLPPALPPLPHGWGEPVRAEGGHGEDLGYWHAERDNGCEVRLWDDGDVTVSIANLLVDAVPLADLRAVLANLEARAKET